jgi:hypothetical protein
MWFAQGKKKLQYTLLESELCPTHRDTHAGDNISKPPRSNKKIDELYMKVWDCVEPAI